MKTLAVYGDSQAEAVVTVLQALPAIADRFNVLYVSALSGAPKPDEAALKDCAVLGEQQLTQVFPYAVKRNIKRVRFPKLEFNLLWPLNCVNPFDKPEPPLYTFGRFPYGDSFIVSCVRKGVPADAIMKYYAPAEWPATWPNLDKLFQRESARLSALDAQNDVKIGSFILKYFRRKRLFWAPNIPANALLAELVYRFLHAAFGTDQPCERSEIDDKLQKSGPRDLLAALSVPIHPLVAKHFKLEWYSADDRYTYFDREFRYDQYFAEMIGRALSIKSETHSQ